jgi:hypothetical protein
MKSIVVLLLVVFTVNGIAQTTYSSSKQTNISFHAPAQGFITELKPPPPGLQGSFYLYDELINADIFMKDSSKFENIRVKIDVRDNFIELEYKNDMKMLPVAGVMAVVLKKNTGNETYINGDALPGTTYRKQFLQVVYDDKVQLFCKTDPEILRAKTNQNPMLNVGETDDKIIMKKKFVIVHDQKVIDAAVPRSTFRAAVMEAFGADLEPSLKKVNNKDVDDLIVLVKELNSRVQ